MVFKYWLSFEVKRWLIMAPIIMIFWDGKTNTHYFLAAIFMLLSIVAFWMTLTWPKVLAAPSTILKSFAALTLFHVIGYAAVPLFVATFLDGIGVAALYFVPFILIYVFVVMPFVGFLLCTKVIFNKSRVL
ncbi:hypothetical protein EDC56_1502 [Sinobacterium caligoides]|uniref:Uncharacterized protein n=1 Tax=Sinobacterium caligoides TaxID=933926 RepID=A0A3N2DMQ3_9GAMM|nr:hypothetical protein [Sinobacterium caligoides]ROS01078.1 hypothetical protein EDC56_1502 [Sinobacterium caligoides]